MAVISRAPGRVCLFGDHQDYLGLPIIACAIDRYVTLKSVANDEGIFKITMPDLGERFELRFPKQVRDKSQESILTTHTVHLINTLKVVSRYGCSPNVGYDIEITSDVPINAGLSSSSAVVVAWLQWLLHTFGCDREVTPEFIGQLAYEAEVLETGGSGGKMDQYTSAIGNIIYLETDGDGTFTPFDIAMSGLIIAQSGIPKDTEGLLGDLKGKQISALEKAKTLQPNFDKKTATLEDYKLFKASFSAEERPFLYAAIENHQITQRALVRFRKSGKNNTPLDLKIIGQLMTEHHLVLKNKLKITVPRVDAMINAALEAGAYGAKIVGSGGGGSICALAPKGKEDQVIQALLKAGAVTASQVNVSKGTHII
ncbi:galactokinase [Dokdonia sinensis]|uniref:Galactokinase n=1 Tax=Dokdonia sinensis TaxID=2479847 RepID=A0A3M0GFN7_9FLAO|nr:galactokinase family protein [Dokdonia sinensis]RMB63911.1 galactokinase [Dokdonia sinensis]